MAAPHRIPAWLITEGTRGLAVLSLALYTIFDISASDVPDKRIFTAAFLCGSFSCLAQLKGQVVHPETFRLIQPFFGGMNFVLLQAMGWIMFSFFICCSGMAWWNPRLTIPRGFFFLQGVLAFSSNCVLTWSIDVFAPSESVGNVHPQTLILGKWGPLAGGAMATSITMYLTADVVLELRRTRTSSLDPAQLLVVGWLCSVLAVLVVHVGIGPSLHPAWRIFQPFAGGSHFVLLQGLGWTLYGIASNLTLMLLAQLDSLAIDRFVLIAGLMAAFASVLLLVSVRYFVADSKAPAHVSFASKWKNTEMSLMVGPILYFFSLAMGLASHQLCLPNLAATALFILMLVGPLSHFNLWASTGAGFSPLTGGSNFVTSQTLGWWLYGVAFVMYVMWTVNGLMCVHPFGLVPLIFFSNLIIHLSVAQYQHPILVDEVGNVDPPSLLSSPPNNETQSVASSPALAPSGDAPAITGTLTTPHWVRGWLRAAKGNFVALLFIHTFFGGAWVVALLPYTVLSFTHASILAVTVLAVYRPRTAAEFDGSREWHTFKNPVRRQFKSVPWALPWSTVFVDPEVATATPRGTPIIFGCHPHGVLPVTWAINFVSNLIERDPLVLTADVLFRFPVVREMALWSGCLNASQKTISSAMQRGRNIVVLPGGLREMGLSQAGGSRNVTVVKRKGFIRAALREGAEIVPVFGFGVDDVYAQWTLRLDWLKELLGFYLFVPIGRFDLYSPRPVPVCHVAGRGIVVKQKPDFDEDDVERLCDEFYGEMARVVTAHIEKHPNCKCNVEYVNGYR